MAQVKENTGMSVFNGPKGEYKVEVKSVKDGFSKGGDPMPSITLTICEGPCEGQIVWDNILIPPLESPSAAILGRTKHFLHCAGEPYEDEEVMWDSDNWVGRIMRARLDVEPPNKHHDKPKPIVLQYILDENLGSESAPF